MNPFAIFGLIICLAVGGFVSRFAWMKLVALIPVAVLVPTYYATGTLCGAAFFLDLADPEAVCAGGHAVSVTFASAYLLSVVPVALSAVVFRLLRNRKG